MRCFCSLIALLFFGTLMFGQISASDTTSVDNEYREDQFYISVTYNLLGKKPDGISQSGFSSGFHFGFIRDMPINKKRNVAIGLGFGISSNSYNQNLLISKNNDQVIEYSLLDKSITSYTKNKFSTYLLEVPLEFRWRTSTPIEYNFLRVYPGFKLSYMVYNSSKFKSSEGDIILSKIEDFNKLQYGVMLNAGYSNINVHFYYGLNTIFKDTANINEGQIGMNDIKIGLIYYIL